MGNALVAYALLNRPLLVNHPRTIIAAAQMGLIAKDHDLPPLYFGGWELIASAMGFKSYTHAADVAVNRAIRELTDLGMIKAASSAAPGQRTAYELHFTPW